MESLYGGFHPAGWVHLLMMDTRMEADTMAYEYSLFLSSSTPDTTLPVTAPMALTVNMEDMAVTPTRRRAARSRRVGPMML